MEFFNIYEHVSETVILVNNEVEKRKMLQTVGLNAVYIAKMVKERIPSFNDLQNKYYRYYT